MTLGTWDEKRNLGVEEEEFGLARLVPRENILESQANKTSKTTNHSCSKISAAPCRVVILRIRIFVGV